MPPHPGKSSVGTPQQEIATSVDPHPPGMWYERTRPTDEKEGGIGRSPAQVLPCRIGMPEVGDLALFFSLSSWHAVGRFAPLTDLRLSSRDGHRYAVDQRPPLGAAEESASWRSAESDHPSAADDRGKVRAASFNPGPGLLGNLDCSCPLRMPHVLCA